MADWYGFARSNYFHVKDKEKFKEFCDKWNLEMFEGDDGTVGMLAGDASSNGGWPRCLWDDDNEDQEVADFDDFFDELATHLDKDVAILQEVGAEKLRYLTGWAVAVNAKGKTVWVNINDIYKKAKKLGNVVSEAEY